MSTVRQKKGNDSPARPSGRLAVRAAGPYPQRSHWRWGRSPVQRTIMRPRALARSSTNPAFADLVMATAARPDPPRPRRQLRRRDPVRLRAGRRPSPSASTSTASARTRRCCSATRSSSSPAASPTATTWPPARSSPTSSPTSSATPSASSATREKLILGICNGFQALLKAGLLVPPDEDGPLATLAHNASGKFEDRWIHLQADAGQVPVPEGLSTGCTCRSPTARGDFVCREEWILQGAGAGRPGRAALRRRRRASRAATRSTRTARRATSPACATRPAGCWA